jgi:polar amino acid transport system permease protein
VNTADIIRYILEGAPTTLEIAIGAWVLGSALGLALAAAQQPGGPIGISAASVITVLRCIPPLVLLYVVFFGLGQIGFSLPPVPSAVVALGLVEASFTAEYFRAGFITVQPGQFDASHSLGFGKIATLRRVVVPQAVIFAVPPLLNSFVGLLKIATLASAVGAPEILYRGQLVYEQSGHIVAVVVAIILLYLVFTIPLTQLIGRLELRLQRTFR